jgi:hypothetical protein
MSREKLSFFAKWRENGEKGRFWGKNGEKMARKEILKVVNPSPPTLYS